MTTLRDPENRIPVRIGSLFDFPQRDGGVTFDAALRLGLDEATAVEGFDRDIEIVQEHVKGLPLGSEHDVVAGVHALDAAGRPRVQRAVGERQRVHRRPRSSTTSASRASTTRAASAPAATSGSTTRSAHSRRSRRSSPNGSRRAGSTRAAVVFEHSPVGRRYAEVFDRAHTGAGIDVTGTAAITSLDPDVTPALERLRRTEPDALVYLGLGYTSHAVARRAGGHRVGRARRRELVADVRLHAPRLARRLARLGVPRRRRRRQRTAEGIARRAHPTSPRARCCAARTTWVACSGPPSPAPTTSRVTACASALERVKQLPATSGYEGTTMGFGVYDHAALKGQYLVLREWRDGETVQVTAE